MKFLASWALSVGRYFRTAGRVRTSFSIVSSNLSLLLRMPFMNSPMGDFFWDMPSWERLKVPSLFSRMTAGMDGNTSMASIRSLCGSTTSTTYIIRHIQMSSHITDTTQ